MIQQELLNPNLARPRRLAAGGLSGALVWQCESLHGTAALRCWPSAHPQPTRLSEIHAAMQVARQQGLLFVPAIYRNCHGTTFSSDGKRLWELTQWMSGTADYLLTPSPARLRGALQALALLHRVWSENASPALTLPSPTARERCQRLDAWLTRLPQLTARTWRSQAADEPAVWLRSTLAADTLRALAEHGPRLRNALFNLLGVPVSLHFVVRDIWSDHVLFSGDQVTGIIDYGAARVDEPAADVARLLGSLEPFQADRWQAGWEFYQQFNPTVDRNRVGVLDQVGTLLAALQWLEWLVLEPREFNAPDEALAARWQNLLRRGLR